MSYPLFFKLRFPKSQPLDFLPSATKRLLLTHCGAQLHRQGVAIVPVLRELNS